MSPLLALLSATMYKFDGVSKFSGIWISGGQVGRRRQSGRGEERAGDGGGSPHRGKGRQRRRGRGGERAGDGVEGHRGEEAADDGGEEDKQAASKP
ncbi:hypothetical protein L1987_46115 [Smallanthus sonchifolius]|uniref:Uncharacterized protein n=1 Tax=Smallanthus sonchifolius TaxID=185202 RepID=A0ACB9FYL2_9ASTR|nr:hypothetical protein L1987_46115 [Smallanthus sonchifolius]